MTTERAGEDLPGRSARNALPRCARLTRPADFKRVFTSPAVSADDFFKVLARHSEMNRPRLGMAVSRQVDKHAVGRNRIKRVIRESFRQHFADCGPPVDFVVLPRPVSATISNTKLRLSLDRLWARVLVRLGERPEQSPPGPDRQGATPHRSEDGGGTPEG
ncbi:MAG TPA: ribonuclease P protein component [Xanthomonadales bacterium]|nr:ribonuclease P protein component [Xanthomonadales bacterium]